MPISRWRGGRYVTSTPSIRIVPLSGVWCPATIIRVVLFPRATGAKERNKLSFANVEAYLANRLDGLKVLGDVGKFNHG